MKLTNVTSKKRTCLNDELENSPITLDISRKEDIVSVRNLHRRTKRFTGHRNPFLAKEEGGREWKHRGKYSLLKAFGYSLSSLSLRI